MPFQLNLDRRWWSVRRSALLHDVRSIARHGRYAPLFNQLITVPTEQLTHRLAESRRSEMAARAASILDGPWDLPVKPVQTVQVEFCVRHWGDGVPWDETGAYEFLWDSVMEHGGRYDGCTTMDDVVARYQRLDDIFEQVRRERRLRTRREIAPGTFRESGGILVHIRRDGSPLWGRDGSHRIAMAQVLNLPVIPARIGVVHHEARDVWRSLYTGGSQLRIWDSARASR